MEQLVGTSLYNIAIDTDIAIREQAKTIFDDSSPDGTPRTLLDISRLSNLCWWAKLPLREGITRTYARHLASFI
jgi:GDP-L-fucose synthase